MAPPYSASVPFHDASQDGGNNRIRRVDITTGATTTLAGSAQFTSSNLLSDIAIDPSGRFVLVVVRASSPPPASRHTAYRLLAHAVDGTHSYRHATSRIGLALFAQTPPPPVHHRKNTASAAWSEAESKPSSRRA